MEETTTAAETAAESTIAPGEVVVTETAADDAADAAFQARLSAMYATELPETPEPAPETPEAEEAPKEAEEEAPENEEETPARPKVRDAEELEVDRRPPWKKAADERRKGKARRELDEAKEVMQTARQQLEEVAKLKAELQTARQLLDEGDVDAGLRALGVDPDESFGRMAERRLSGEAQKKDDPLDIRRELEELRKSQADMVREAVQEALQQQSTSYLQQQEQEFFSSQEKGMGMIRSDEGLKAKYPALASLPEDMFRNMVGGTIAEIREAGPEAVRSYLGDNIALMAEHLETQVREMYSALHGRLGAAQVSGSPDAASQPKARQQHSTPSRGASSAGGASDVDDDPDGEALAQRLREILARTSA